MKVLTVFEAVVLEPEDVEVGFVSGDDLVVGEFLKRSVSLRFSRSAGVPPVPFFP